MTLETYDVENIAENRLKITNPMNERTGHRSNLNHQIIYTIGLATIDENME